MKYCNVSLYLRYTSSKYNLNTISVREELFEFNNRIAHNRSNYRDSKAFCTVLTDSWSKSYHHKHESNTTADNTDNNNKNKSNNK